MTTANCWVDLFAISHGSTKSCANTRGKKNIQVVLPLMLTDCGLDNYNAYNVCRNNKTLLDLLFKIQIIAVNGIES